LLLFTNYITILYIRGVSVVDYLYFECVQRHRLTIINIIVEFSTHNPNLIHVIRVRLV